MILIINYSFVKESTLSTLTPSVCVSRSVLFWQVIAEGIDDTVTHVIRVTIIMYYYYLFLTHEYISCVLALYLSVVFSFSAFCMCVSSWSCVSHFFSDCLAPAEYTGPVPVIVRPFFFLFLSLFTINSWLKSIIITLTPQRCKVPDSDRSESAD